MDSEKWRNQQIELERLRIYRKRREKQVEHATEAKQSDEQANRRMDMLGVYGTAFICALIGCALGLAWYADNLGWVNR